VIFAVINGLISPITDIIPSKYLKCVISAFLELTNGVDIIQNNISSNYIKLILISGALGWSGLSVHMQVKSIVSRLNLSLKKYYITRALCSLISMIISYFVFSNYSYETESINAINTHTGQIFVVISVFLTVCLLVSEFIFHSKCLFNKAHKKSVNI
jgi:uncharacterized membrane protein YdjX (TVP38/TMEM64 family)